MKSTSLHKDLVSVPRTNVRYLTICGALIILILVFAIVVPVWASKPCQQSDMGERLKCKNENVQMELDLAVLQLTDDDANFLSPEQKSNLKNARDRAGRATDRNEAKTYKQLARKADPECYVKEYDNKGDPDDDGDNNGICITKGPNKELCMEIDDDQIGNNNSKCEKIEGQGKPVFEACVEICDQETIDANEDNFDAAVAADMEQSMDDTTNALVAMNEKVANYLYNKRSVQNTWRVLGEDADACAEVLIGNRDWSLEELQGLQAGSTAAKLAADTCRDYCTQTAFGFNCRGACTFFSVAENVLLAFAQGAELDDDTVSADRLDAAANCLEVLGAKISGLDEKLDEVLDLLNTPPGQRPEFPLKR